ncbi:MAG: winged helix-turn-helix domain-containing protein [bacterium]|nr:winged helix-turn-helix domain-containing protein [bacterium]
MERLSRLFGSPARLRTIRLFMFNQDSALTSAEVAERTKLSKEAASREIKELLAAGLLRKKGTRPPTRYQADPHFEHLIPLNAFIRETTSVRPKKIVSELKRAGTLRLVALSGHFTGILEPQIDLLVVGDHLDERILAHVVHALEAELGREIRYASFATADFRYRLGVYDRLLRDVFDYPHRLLIDKIGL